MNIRNILKINWAIFIVIFFVLMVAFREIDYRGWLSIPVNKVQKEKGRSFIEKGVKHYPLTGFPFATTPETPIQGTNGENKTKTSILTVLIDIVIQVILSSFVAYIFSIDRQKIKRRSK